jgi:hypothetical protein
VFLDHRQSLRSAGFGHIIDLRVRSGRLYRVPRSRNERLQR